MPPRALSLKVRLWTTAVLALAGSAALMLVAMRTIDNIKIKGPLYHDIVSYKDLLADILPPPAYLIESYLTCIELTRAEPAEQERLLVKLQKLEMDYRDRNAFWQTELKHAGLRQTMLEEATKPAFEYFATLKSAFIPAIRKNDQATALAILDGPLTASYRAHRAAIDKTVELANKEVEAVEATADASLTNSIRMLWVAAVGINALLLLLTYFSIRSILRPMSSLTTYANHIAEGDYDCTCVITGAREITNLSSVLAHTVDKIKESITQAGEAEQLAQTEAQNARRQTQKAEEETHKAEQAKRQGMLDAALKLERVVDIVGTASDRLAAQIEQSSRGAQVQAHKAEEVAAAMEQMNATVLEVARNATQSAATSGKAQSKANEGASVVTQVIRGIGEVESTAVGLKDQMTELGKQSESIGQILNVISDIADQTNLLALNAAIEAARAGDAGRGFAVVADEVRKLAEKTMTATRQVDVAIQGVQASTRANIQQVERAVDSISDATRLAGMSGQALQDIVTLVEAAAGQVHAIAASAEQQSSASDEINRAVEDVNTVAKESSLALGDAAKAVFDLTRQTTDLRLLIQELKGKDKTVADL